MYNKHILICDRSGVGAAGDKQTIYYVEVTDEMRTSQGTVKGV